MNVILYGPPGAGKSTVGRMLAERLGRPFVDSDDWVQARAGQTIPQIFAERGEAGFRLLEAEACAELAAHGEAVIALGGGALLNPISRAALERSGLVVCLRAGAGTLAGRVAQAGNGPNGRPLLGGDDPAGRLAALLEQRRALYDSFPAQVDTSSQTATQVAETVQAMLAPRNLPITAPGFEHRAVLGYGLMAALSRVLAEHGLPAPGLVVTDENVAGKLPAEIGNLPRLVIAPGEAHKTLDTVRSLYDAFLQHGLDRGSLVVAVGGGVMGDMVGFAAATYMRGIRWVNVPTTLLAMVDASLGGKTGVDLPQGKNLVGAFHPPALILSDPLALTTLPRREWVSGMAEVIKHGLIDDPALFESLEAGQVFGSVDDLARAMAVKVRVVNDDPFEKGRRAILNVGHTIGHGVEAASGFELSHGEAVAIGMAAEARLAHRLGLAEAAVAHRIERVCAEAGLPVKCPGLDAGRIRAAMSSDKKKAGRRLKFALPKALGQAVWGIEAEEALVNELLKEIVSP